MAIALLSRGIGESQLISLFPEAAIALAGVLTQLGDLWFVLLWIVGVYAISRNSHRFTDEPWRDCVYLFALVLGAYFCTAVLKHVFALPRPPGATTAALPAWLPSVVLHDGLREIVRPVYESMMTGAGYGFPSGHAVLSTAVYGGAALTLDLGGRARQRWLAVGIILLVAMTRVVLGVHYLVDVVAGAIVGAIFLWITVAFLDRDPKRTVYLTGLLGILTIVLSFGRNVIPAAISMLSG